MTYDYISTGDSGTESRSEPRTLDDERRLYGEPHHESRGEYDEQALYGDPQHELRDEDDDSRDIEVLFARMQVAPVIRPRTPGPRTSSPRTPDSQTPSAAGTTER